MTDASRNADSPISFPVGLSIRNSTLPPLALSWALGAAAHNNFRKKILDLSVLEWLEKKFTGAANKAPYLYCFPKE